MTSALTLLTSSVLWLLAGGFLGGGQDIVIRDAPRPVAYAVAARTLCGDVDFRVEISTSSQSSRIIRATANGRDVVLYADNGVPLAGLIRDTRIIGLQPSMCIANEPSIRLAVATYDAKRDAIAGQSGETTIMATATAPK